MPTVEFVIGHQTHKIACEAGEEEHILFLVQRINERMAALARQFSSAGEHLIFAIQAIMMEDELLAMQKKLEVASLPAVLYPREEQDAEFAELLEDVALRIETLAENIKSS